MVSHPNRSKNAPRCLNCGDPLRKKTRAVYVMDATSGARTDLSSDFQRVIKLEQPLADRAACQRHTNLQVVSVSYWPETSAKGRSVSSFGEWDGESYVSVAGYFCTGACAYTFAEVAAKAGFRRPGRTA